MTSKLFGGQVTVINQALLKILTYGYIFSLFLGTVPSTQFSFAFITGALLTIAVLIDSAMFKRVPKPNPLIWGLWPLVFVVAIADVANGFGLTPHPILRTMMLNLVMFSIVVHLFSYRPEFLISSQNAFIFAGTVAAILSTMDFSVVEQQFSGRVTLTHINLNDYAAILSISIFFSLKKFVEDGFDSSIRSFVFVAALLILLNAVAETVTRFVLISLVVLYATALASSLFYKNTFKSVCIVSAASVVFLVLKTLAFKPISNRMVVNEPGPDFNNLGDLGGRLPVWNNGVNAFLESPIFGKGYFGFEQYTLQFSEFFSRPHNVVLEVAAVSGMAGLLIVFGFTAFFLRSAITTQKSERAGMLMSLVPLAFISLSINITHFKPFWFLFAFTIATIIVQRIYANDGPIINPVKNGQ